MKAITISKQGNTILTIGPRTVDPVDKQIQINTGKYSTATVNILQGYNVQGVGGGTLGKDKTVTLQLDKYTNFYVISGSFTQLFGTIDASQVAGVPGELKTVSFDTIASQSEYSFDGTVTEWNPQGINLITANVPQIATNGLIKNNWTFSAGNVSLSTPIYAGVPVIVSYQLLQTVPNS